MTNKINVIFLIILNLFYSTSCETPAEESLRQFQVAVKSETRYGSGFLITIEHDGHWFILEGHFTKGAMIHHPDCPCGKSH